MPIRKGQQEYAFTRWVIPFIFLIVFAGFARTFYLRPFFRPPPITLLFQAHGAIMTAWLLLFATQAVLIKRKQTDLHRALGPFVAALAALATISGLVALYARIVGSLNINLFSEEFFKAFVANDGASLLLFAMFVTAGIMLRRRADAHKRLMLLAAINLLPPAVVRIVSILAQRLRLWETIGVLPPQGGGLALFVSENVALIVLVIMTFIVLAVVVVDSTRKRPMTPAILWGGALMVADYAATFHYRTHP